ncbi:hypothetical protein O181_051881 [Austropuccinia psidii MF-1]|uniref:Uncharacterized protein n=1 Tax=Austropuccinia psidii MF-1 TaxID=1389203 RepID=A0A9Q3E4K0_9BASI|nr:hypothetical protein [Austropuccinia psidii MF-1]
MSPVHLRNLGIPRNQAEDREGLSRTKRPGRGYLGHSGGWQTIERNQTHSAIHFPIQQKPQTRGLEGYGSSSSAPQTTQISLPIEHGQQEVQHSIPLGRTWSKFSDNMSQRDTLQRPYGITKGWNPNRKFRLLEERESRIRENQATIQAIEEKLTQTGNTQIPSGSQGVRQTISPVPSHHSGTNRSVATSNHSSQSQVVSRRIQGYKGKNKTSFNQRKGESDPMIQKLLDLVKEVHKSQK